MVALTPLSSCEKACDIVRVCLASNTHMGLTEDFISPGKQQLTFMYHPGDQL